MIFPSSIRTALTDGLPHTGTELAQRCRLSREGVERAVADLNATNLILIWPSEGEDLWYQLVSKSMPAEKQVTVNFLVCNR